MGANQMKAKSIPLYGGVLLALLLSACGGSTTTSSASAANTAGPTTASSAAAEATASTSGSRPKVAGLFTQFVDQGNWDVAGYKAFDAMCQKYDFECSYVEQASYEKAPAIMRDYAAKGYDMIISHSSGYAAAIEEVAAECPDTEFALFSYASDTKGLDNYSAWSVNWDQAGYLEGSVAGLSSETGKVGIVGGEKIPSTLRGVEFARDGVSSAKPGADAEVVWVGSFVDVAKGKQVGLQAIDAGADVIVPMADLAGQGAQQAAAETGNLTLGEYIDEGAIRLPDSIVTSLIVNMDQAYDEIGQNFVDGTLDGQIVQMDASTGAFSFAPFRNVPDDVATQANAILAGLADGSITLASR